jgi:ligand-binding sensor domain-containing protein/signal transduction histidine kinase
LRSLSTFPNEGFGRRWFFKWAIAGLAAVCFAGSASAIDPNRMVSQYMHDSWGTEKGFPGGSVSAIAQTTDGYLWVGTDKGLIRFDGLNFRRFEQSNPNSFVIGPIRALLADAQENLWILLQNTKLFRYHDGTLDLSRGEAENGVTAMGQGTAGAIVLSSLAMGTLTHNGNRFLTVLPAPAPADSAAPPHGETPDERSARLSWSTGVMPDRLAAPTSAVISIAATTDGKIWLGTEDRGLFYLREGRVYAAANGLPGMKVNCLLPADNSELWVGTNQGVWHWNGTELTRAGVPSALLHVEVLSMIRDRDSNSWVGTTRGLLRFNANGVSSLATGTSEAPVAVTALFEDREGNLWVGSGRGLERLRDSAFATYPVPGLKSQSMGPLYVGPDDRTWVAPIEGGLRWLKGEEGGSVTAAGLSHDSVYSITGSGQNDVWVGRQRGGLTHLRLHGAVTATTYTQADGLAQNSVYAVYESHDGTVWSGTLSGGVSELRNGHFTTYTTANGLASDTVSSIAEGSDGTMWFGTPRGLSALAKNGWRTYTVRDGLSSQDVNCLLRDSTGVLWIGTAEGLAFLSAGHLQVPHGVPDWLQHEPIFGMAEDRNGWLWIATASHVLQVKRSSLMGEVLKEPDFREYGLADGLRGTEGVKRYQSVVADSQGRVWFSTNRGLSVVNPTRGTVNSVPALVHIEAVLADGSPFDLGGPIRVPAAKQRTTFRYVGLSLSNSERVRYRYKLDGFDHGWSEPVTNLEAAYANLGAGSYRFRVMASNGDGLWNGSEAAVGFEVVPAHWQAWWFRLACVLFAGLATLVVYRVRIHQLTQLLNVRFEERLAERTRIAQDLHDTLLQGVLSASMQLHVAVDQLPDDSPARTTMNRVLHLLGLVIEEGRNTLRGLRSSLDYAYDLEVLFSRIPQEVDNQQVTDFRVVVEGQSLPLRPVIRDDVYRIGREAVVNAFRHSRASSIEVLLEYAPSQLRILVRDDGCGIDSLVLQSGRAGHWGLSGMRERAERIGARLTVFSRTGGGTEVELRVPSDIAFASHPSRLASKWLTSFHRRQKLDLPAPKERAG